MKNISLSENRYYQDGTTLKLRDEAGNNRGVSSVREAKHGYDKFALRQGDRHLSKKNRTGTHRVKKKYHQGVSKTRKGKTIPKPYAVKTIEHKKKTHKPVSYAYAKALGLKKKNTGEIKESYAYKSFVPVPTEEEKRRVLSHLKGTMSLSLTALLVLLVGVVLYFGFDYLKLSASIDEHMDTIKSLEDELETLKNENDAVEEGIDTSINLNEIYDAAVNRLGMVHADQKSVITYDKSESEYVRQNEDIPPAN